MTGISNATLSSWLKGEYRNNDNSAVEIDGLGKPLTHCQTVKRLKDISELALVSNTAESNSVGSLFLLKSNFGYREDPVALPETKADPDIIDISFLTDQGNMAELPKYDDD